MICLGTFLAGVFAGSETGSYTIRRLRLRYKAEEERDPASVRLWRMLTRPELFLTSMLIATNLAIYAASSSATALFERAGFARAEVATTLALSLPLFALAEVFPKELFRRAADRLLPKLSTVLRWVYLLFLPASAILSVGSLVLARRRRTRFRPTRRLLRLFLEQGTVEGFVTPRESELAENVLSMSTTGIRSLMLPISRAVVARAESTIDELLASKPSYLPERIPLRGSRRDEIVGMVSIFDIIGEPGERRLEEFSRPALFLPDDATVQVALRRLQSSRAAVGVVVRGKRAVGLVFVREILAALAGGG